MRVCLLLGPAGSGKTFRCLTEIRQALVASPDGSPLVLAAPRQMTYQLERQLLADPALAGYTRLQVLSFERLAHFVFDQLHLTPPGMLDEEGRLMVLRGLLAKRRDQLKLFRASARLGGFARELSAVLSEFQRHQLTPESLLATAAQVQNNQGLAWKLHDLATLLRDYLDWLKAHHLQDADSLLSAATQALTAAQTQRPPPPIPESRPRRKRPKSAESDLQGLLPGFRIAEPPAPLFRPAASGSAVRIAGLWVDGFLEWSAQELEFLATLLPHCDEATLTLCLDRIPSKEVSWLSTWSVARKAFDEARNRLAAVPEADVRVKLLTRNPAQGRFPANRILQHLERCWAEADAPSSSLDVQAVELGKTLRVAVCPDAEAEVTLAAREILSHVRAGGRYREVSVLVRRLEHYHAPLQRVFSRYGIPFFLDRREPVAQHPLLVLTRHALRVVALGWQHEDWFAALKTGLVPATDDEIDNLENEALARGWKGAAWHQPLVLRDAPKSAEGQARLIELQGQLEDLRQRIVPPFERLQVALAAGSGKPTGPELTAALRELWQRLAVEERLKSWAAAESTAATGSVPGAIHATIWEQMNAWLTNIDLGFPIEPLSQREWLPIVEAGLGNLSVGVIPPALDQVLIGAIDRSRNPEIKLALVLGLNEGVFPAPPDSGVLLTEGDRAELEARDVRLGLTARQRLGRERYYGYLGCTRARERLVLTCARQDAEGSPLNPSPFISQFRRLFPALEVETEPRASDWRQSDHPSELIGPLLRVISGTDINSLPPDWQRMATLSPLSEVIAGLGHLGNPDPEASLAPALAERLYGPKLLTSVSRMERFAACPFRFFVHSGLRAEERIEFELGVREQGSFQHDVLAFFHEELHRDGKRWSDITPAEARERIARITGALQSHYGQGLLDATEQTRFMARMLTRSLQDFAQTMIEWMSTRQYRVEPARVELPFGEADGAPAWEIELDPRHRLALRGRIDRVDLYSRIPGEEAFCVVVDYKSSEKKLDPLLIENGIQLQLLAYLNVMRYWPDPRGTFGVARLVPAGVFYVSLRGNSKRELNRRDALADPAKTRKQAYVHPGRFDFKILRLLDARPSPEHGDQFRYRIKKDGTPYRTSTDPVETAEFERLMESVETALKRMGVEVYAGRAAVAPYQKGKNTACRECEYQAICRFDPWTNGYRVLRSQ